MYERKNGTKRLLKALQNTDNIERLAEVLRYVPEQLEQDIEALGDYIRDAEEAEEEAAAEFERQSKPYGVFEMYTWDDVSYTLIDRYETREEAEARAKELEKESDSKFVPTESMSFNPVCYSVYSNLEYYNLMH
jgi:hypothetical protein